MTSTHSAPVSRSSMHNKASSHITYDVVAHDTTFNRCTVCCPFAKLSAGEAFNTLCSAHHTCFGS